ncbi:hypothetical protein X777_05434 [Ooceraea biroi]|uniref:Uncharacterized protein n=1 Tax=Ooceraea biroi TaxID=2015173 RepID=A0A026X1I2_OOCBI|nr:hypothetical protein X777_05434 [Ooceraea biroi]
MPATLLVTPSDQYPSPPQGTRDRGADPVWGWFACVSVVGVVAPQESGSHSPHLQRATGQLTIPRTDKFQFERRATPSPALARADSRARPFRA